jgi:shikimate dehydrogenase/3-dehydroquinate dehydratase type I
MTAGPRRIVVSLPARSFREARRQAEEARVAGADLAEVRLDRWPPSEREQLGSLFPCPLPLLATVRSRAEGGEGPDDPAERAALLTAAAAHPFDFVDVEPARDAKLVEQLRPSTLRLVHSSHYVTPVDVGEVKARLQEPVPPTDVRKVVVPATFARAVREFVPLLNGGPGPRPVLLVTGPAGELWRAWAFGLGIPWVFASLPDSSSTEKVEPSQLPVDRLRGFLAAGDAPIFAVVGHPVTHSRSPSLHHTWMHRAGCAGLYVRLDLASEEEFALALDTLPARGVRGLNVTIPWKRLAYECAGVRSGDAIASGAANCLAFRDGRVEAENTDVGAIRRRFAELVREGRWDGRSVTVLGGGGAARATLAAARDLECEVTVVARRASVAASLADEFGATAGDPGSPRPSSLVVHATNVGRARGDSLPLALASYMAPGGYVLDWVYSPEDPVLSQESRRVGATYEDGGRLLVYQAAASYAVWWGEPPGEAAVEEAVREGSCTA